MKIYDKLVRDKIPEVIAADNNKKCVTRILSDEQYLKELDKKLFEEMQEYLNSGDIEELADIAEVMFAILKAKGFTREQLEDTRIKKAEKRGGFDKKIFLISVDEGTDDRTGNKS